jgi:hypothetical protein
MEQTLKKLQYKGQSPALVLNVPAGLELIKDAGESIEGKYAFILAFARTLEELKGMAKGLTEAIEGEGYLWICYPKGTSKKYKSDINRNTLLAAFGPYGFEGVTQIAVDDDWSALRVRPVDEIRTMKRQWAVSEKGKERIKENKK